MPIIKNKEIKVWNLPVAETGAQIGDYQFKRVPEYNKLNIANVATHILTALAKKGVNKPKESVLIEGGSELSDILLLYNFFKRGNACLDDHSSIFPYYKVTNGLELKQMPCDQLQGILQKTLDFIQKPEWKEKHKDKVLAFNWLLVARMPDYLQLRFFKTWSAIDLIKGKVCDTLCGKLLNVSPERFNIIRKFWREIRNSYVHEGACNYEHFLCSGINGFYDSNRTKSRFEVYEKTLFNQQVNKKNFDDFKCASIDIIENVLTLFFLEILGTDNTQILKQMDQIGWYIKRMNYYFNNLHMPKPSDLTNITFTKNR